MCSIFSSIRPILAVAPLPTFDGDKVARSLKQDKEETVAGNEVEGGVVKVIELVGSSPNSFSDAVRNAVRTAAATIRNIQGVEVLQSNATVGGNGEIDNYKVNVKIAFLIERGGDVGQNA
jgi:dodecin